MENWLEIAVGIYLLAMILYGHYRGFIKMAVSLVAVVATLVVVHVAMPQVSVFLKNETPIYQWISDGIQEAIIPDEEQMTPSDERSMIENMNLPEEVKYLLIENNNHEVYESLGVQAFAEYISSYLTGLIVNVAGYVILFVLVYTAIQLLMRWLDLMAKLPLISGINKMAGALLGAIQGLFFLWLASLLLTAFAASGWAKPIIAQIEDSSWLSFLYHSNILAKIVFGLIKSIF